MRKITISITGRNVLTFITGEILASISFSRKVCVCLHQKGWQIYCLLLNNRSYQCSKVAGYVKSYLYYYSTMYNRKDAVEVGSSASIFRTIQIHFKYHLSRGGPHGYNTMT